MIKFLKRIFSRFLHLLARFLPGTKGFRVYCHRLRGVKIGKNVFIGYDAIIETESPELVTIGDGAAIGIQTIIIAHHHGSFPVVIEDQVDVGPGSIVLPGVTIGKGSVVAAGSVVTRSIPPMTFVQGNPAVAIAKCGIPLTANITMKEFIKNLKPLKSKKPELKNESKVS